VRGEWKISFDLFMEDEMTRSVSDPSAHHLCRATRVAVKRFRQNLVDEKRRDSRDSPTYQFRDLEEALARALNRALVLRERFSGDSCSDERAVSLLISVTEECRNTACELFGSRIVPNWDAVGILLMDHLFDQILTIEDSL
jgi:hypothetical protein